MILHFGYIEGISRIDTPYFAIKAEQEDYFDSHEVVSIESSFYPPHYLNEIKVDTDDIDFNTTINYVWFEYNNKTYYYFIDDIDYISETVIVLHVTMDTIQTYMFNIRVSNGIIERKFINRWNGNNINRSYIRENVSKDEYTLTSFNILNKDINKWYIISKNTELWTNKTVTSQIKYYIDGVLVNELSDIPASCSFGITFLKPRVNTYNIVIKSWGHPDRVENAGTVSIDQRAYNLAITKPWCADCYICPFEAIPNIDLSVAGEYDYNASMYWAEGLEKENYGWQATWFVSGVTNTYVGSATNRETLIADYWVRWLKHKYEFDFTKNENIRVVFNSKYMPIMLDTNYIHFTFGSYYSNTTFPIYLLTSPTLYCWYTFIMDTGDRYYLINTHSNNIDDEYRNGVTDNNVLSLELKNDAWESYVAQNRSRWVGAIGNTALDVIGHGASSYFGNAKTTGAIDDILTDTRSYTPKKGLLKKKYQRQVNTMKRNQYLDNQEGVINNIGSSSRGIIGQFISDFNEQCKPTTLKTTGNNTALFNKSAYIFTALEKSIDYEQCAKYFHKNGYLVNEYINSVNNIFAYVQNRWYFNVLKMSDVDLHLIGIIEDEGTLDIIKERLFDGIRLWNVNNSITKLTLSFTMNHLSPTVPLPQIGDAIHVEFECEGHPAIDGVIDNIQEDERYVIPVIITIKTNNRVNITQPDNYSLFTSNGQNYSFDYLINSIRWDEDIHRVKLGDFTYDNVENDYL